MMTIDQTHQSKCVENVLPFESKQKSHVFITKTIECTFPKSYICEIEYRMKFYYFPTWWAHWAAADGPNKISH
jgi:hypothetical protein